MYILIPDDIADGFAPVSAAHASLMGHLIWSKKECAIGKCYEFWLASSFRKVVCRISRAEFEKVKRIPSNIVVTESNVDNKEVAIAFCPRYIWPTIFKYFKLWKPNDK